MDEPAAPLLPGGGEEQQPFCNLRCMPGHDCVLFAAGSFGCLRTALLASLPAGANCRDPPQTNYSVTPDELRCGPGLVCREAYCQHPCPPCPPGAGPIAKVFPDREPAFAAEACCDSGAWGFCGSRADCGGADSAWTCAGGVCAPPWRPGPPRRSPTPSPAPAAGPSAADYTPTPPAGGPRPTSGGLETGRPGPPVNGRPPTPPATTTMTLTVGGPVLGPLETSAPRSLGGDPRHGFPSSKIAPRLVPRAAPVSAGTAAPAPLEDGAVVVDYPHQVKRRGNLDNLIAFFLSRFSISGP
ncbi:MAG: hypothetical protein BJ554DRAFT_3485 [Olpidium bornovanus]|uniref:Uncharacterized protein n=1 Tax=Olpidium bornovanus TaxID=278681 RepID=A0A8H8DG71_9FUNG|nr:MAG: hypothetical protein BJ554DRAFT_3485 [Olpidium bornovanus]